MWSLGVLKYLIRLLKKNSFRIWSRTFRFYFINLPCSWNSLEIQIHEISHIYVKIFMFFDSTFSFTRNFLRSHFILVWWVFEFKFSVLFNQTFVCVKQFKASKSTFSPIFVWFRKISCVIACSRFQTYMFIWVTITGQENKKLLSSSIFVILYSSGTILIFTLWDKTLFTVLSSDFC